MNKKTKIKKNIPTTMRLYLDHVDKYDLLTNEEMCQLVLDYQQGDEQALEKLVCANLRLVIHIAKDVRKKNKSTLDFEDLIQFGNIGLFKACKRFSPEVNKKFSSYAGPWIKHTMERGIENEGATIRHPVSFYNRKKIYQRNYNKLSQKLKRAPTSEEMQKATGITLKQVLDIEKDAAPTSMDVMIGDSDKTTIEDLIEDENSSTEKILESEFLYNQLHIALKEDLDDKEYDIVVSRNALFGGKKKTLQQLSEQYNISKERVRQVYGDALSKLLSDTRIQELYAYLPDIKS